MIEKNTLDKYNQQYLKKHEDLNRLIKMRNNSLDPDVSRAVDMKIDMIQDSIYSSRYVGCDNEMFRGVREAEVKSLQGAFFGEDVLSCDNVEERAADLFKYRFINKVEYYLSILEKMKEKDVRNVAFLEECIELFNIDEINSIIEEGFSEDNFDGNIIVLKNLVESIRNGDIEADVLVKVLLNRKNQIQEKERDVMNVIESCKNNFIKTISEGIQRGELPESASKVLDKIASMNVKIFDILVNQNAYKRGESGEFRDIGIRSDITDRKYEDVLKHIIYHELIHSVSGKIIKLYLGGDYDEQDDDNNMRFIKSGLRIRPEKKSSLLGYGSWADEGAVEWLTIKLFGEIEKKHKDFASYTEEVNIIKKLVSLGMDEMVVWEALFEGYDGDRPRKGVGEKMVKFINGVNLYMGEGSYAKLNNQDLMHRMDETLFKARAYSEDVYGAGNVTPRLEFEITIGKGKGAVSKKFTYYDKENGEITIGYELAGIIKDLKMVRGKITNWTIIDEK